MTKITKCIILADKLSKRLSPLTKDKPVFMLPVFNRPLVEYSIQCLAGMGINEIIFAASMGTASTAYLESLRRKNGLTIDIHYTDDEKPRGSAGILRDMRDFIGNDKFLVVDGNSFLGTINLNDIVAYHDENHSVVTIAVQVAKRFLSEGVQVADDNAVGSFYSIHHSVERRSVMKPLGVYVFNPEALEFVKDDGYFDIQEQLIPLLKNASLNAYTYEIKESCKAINSIEDYYEAHRENLFTGHAEDGYKMLAEGIWVGENVSISPNTYILGPVLIGNNCMIEEGSRIIGPTVLGNGCTIGRGVLVRESILWDNCRVEQGSALGYCIAGSGLYINSGKSFKNKVLVGNLSFGDINLLPAGYEFNGVAAIDSPQVNRFKYRTFLRIKRFVDIVFASLGLIVFSPLMLLIAAAIRIDSRGPIVFWQKRCGKDGKEFGMLKFRTMIEDAESLQERLAAQKECDGPMFKLSKDPRVTKVGRILRSTSLDELPQFINVLKGDMSLVGPRPLVMEEMKFCSSWRDIRLKVKPGITGLWQVEGRSDSPFHSWIRYDVFYVENQSVWLDIKILFRTIIAVFKRAGAY